MLPQNLRAQRGRRRVDKPATADQVASPRLYPQQYARRFQSGHITQTNWARRKVRVDAAMLAAGHASVQMHKRYVNLKADDVAEAFGLEIDRNGRQEVSEQKASRAK
jgi:hypothetical protein